MVNYIDNTQDIIDVRDIIERVEELESSIQDYENEDGDIELRDEHISQKKELEELRGVLSELAGYGGDEQFEGDWYPVSLIHDNYFETAMDELLEDIGDIPRDLPCYLTITVDYVALKQDYSSVDIGSETYWYR